ncbi:MAG: hypothetical protein Q9163_006367 [Psora crenata]
MGKLFGKKSEDGGEEESKRSALFGGRSKSSKSADAQTQNPYANLPSQSDAYMQAKARAGVPGYAQRGPSPGPPPGYTAASNRYPDHEKKSAGFGPGQYGTQSGYGGDNRYWSGSGSASQGGGSQGGGSRYGGGGYGGLGSLPSPGASGPDEKREALFGGAKERVEKQQVQQMGYGQPPPYEDGGQGGNGGSSGPSYEAYGDRQLTAEEEEEEDVLATKQQMRFIKQEDVSSTRTALRLAAQAEEQGMNTLARIGAQGERIHNTEKNLDLTANHNRLAEEKAKELKQLNRSMFAVHVSNPFTSSSRREQRDLDILEKHGLERAQREASRREGYESNLRMQKTFKDMSKNDPNGHAGKKSSLAERAKYQFEADSEDEELENEIDSNLNALGAAASRLNGLARATGKELDEQNRDLERVNGKSTKVDDQLALNRARLDRFR